MREVEYEKIVQTVEEMVIQANYDLEESVRNAFKEAYEKEISSQGKEILQQLMENERLAREEGLPICQDTGVAVFFVELGEEVRVVGGGIKSAIVEGMKRGYKNGYLRKSMVKDPFRRENTGDNSPPIIHFDIVEGDKITIYFMAKGGGSENMSVVRLFPPHVGKEGVIDFVVKTVDEAGGNPCPPIIVGIGIGGNLEKSAILAKKALLRKIGIRNPDPFYAEMELEILNRINKLGIGPMGLGGKITALDVHIEAMPCHIASLPVAVNIECHAHRIQKRTI